MQLTPAARASAKCSSGTHRSRCTRQQASRTSSRGPTVDSRRTSTSHVARVSSASSRNVSTSPSSSSTARKDVSHNAAARQRLVISWAGAGIYFWWQTGAMKYLQEHFDMRKVHLVGASAGSLLSVLAACGVPADRVLEHAYRLSQEHNIWERPLGLVGIWGSLIEQWLDELLPDNAHEICRGRVTVVVTMLPEMAQVRRGAVVVTMLPEMAQVGISDFSSKQDLINVCMASSHVPFVLDFKPTRPCRGRQCVDGSVPDFFSGQNAELLRYGPEADPSRPAVVFDYFDDPRLNRKGRMDMLEVKSYQEIKRMYRVGYEYAAQLHANGRFDRYQLSELLLQGPRGHMSEVLVPEGNGNSHHGSSSNGNGSARNHASSSNNRQPVSSSAAAAAAASFASSSSASGDVSVSADSSAAAAAGGHSSGVSEAAAVAAVGATPPMGLVLELEQGEEELIEGMHTATPQPQRAGAGAGVAAGAGARGGQQQRYSAA